MAFRAPVDRILSLAMLLPRYIDEQVDDGALANARKSIQDAQTRKAARAGLDELLHDRLSRPA